MIAKKKNQYLMKEEDNEMEESQIIFKIKEEFESLTPDVWGGIEGKIKEKIKNEMLTELNKVPSPRGSFLKDRRETFLDLINRKGA